MDMSERAEACRKKALQCEHAAIIATDMGARLMYLDNGASVARNGGAGGGFRAAVYGFARTQ